MKRISNSKFKIQKEIIEFNFKDISRIFVEFEILDFKLGQIFIISYNFFLKNIYKY